MIGMMSGTAMLKILLNWPARKSALPAHFPPQLAVLVDHPPEGDAWLHEIKFDGYRILAFLKAGKVRLVTRNGKDWTKKFPAIADALSKLKGDSAILDGEVVVLDEHGRSDFQALQAMLKSQRASIRRCSRSTCPSQRADLTQTPLIDRKTTLADLLKHSKSRRRSHTAITSRGTAIGCSIRRVGCRWKESSRSAPMRRMSRDAIRPGSKPSAGRGRNL